MLKVQILNKSEFDVVVDTKGNNDPKDKIIVPAKVSVVTEIPNKLRHTIKSDDRLDVIVMK